MTVMLISSTTSSLQGQVLRCYSVARLRGWENAVVGRCHLFATSFLWSNWYLFISSSISLQNCLHRFLSPIHFFDFPLSCLARSKTMGKLFAHTIALIIFTQFSHLSSQKKYLFLAERGVAICSVFSNLLNNSIPAENYFLCFITLGFAP